MQDGAMAYAQQLEPTQLNLEDLAQKAPNHKAKADELGVTVSQYHDYLEVAMGLRSNKGTKRGLDTQRYVAKVVNYNEVIERAEQAKIQLPYQNPVKLVRASER